jgi:hypothetical protein
MNPRSQLGPVLAGVHCCAWFLARFRAAGIRGGTLEQRPVTLAALDVLFALPVESGFISVET